MDIPRSLWQRILKEGVINLNPKETSNIFSITTEEISEYVGRKYKMSNYINKFIEKISIIDLTKPNEPDNTAGKTDRNICKN